MGGEKHANIEYKGLFAAREARDWRNSFGCGRRFDMTSTDQRHAPSGYTWGAFVSFLFFVNPPMHLAPLIFHVEKQPTHDRGICARLQNVYYKNGWLSIVKQFSARSNLQ